MTPSPMNLSTVPPSSDIAPETCSRYVEIWTRRSSGARVSEWLEKFSRSEKNTVRNRDSTPKASGMPDLTSWRTTSRGTKGGEGLQRGPKQRSCGFQAGDLPDIGRPRRGRVKMQAFDFLQLPGHAFDRLR